MIVVPAAENGIARRFCTNCGAVIVAGEGASCPSCGVFGLTADGEKWRRARTRCPYCTLPRGHSPSRDCTGDG